MGVLERVRVVDKYPFHWPSDPVSWLTPRGTLCAWVAELDRRIVGHVVLHAVAHGDADWEAATARPASDLAAISRLFVDPDHRCAGIGARLLETASAEAMTQGLHPVLEVVDTRTDAMKLYEKRGWRRVLTKPWSANAELTHHFYVAV